MYQAATTVLCAGIVASVSWLMFDELIDHFEDGLINRLGLELHDTRQHLNLQPQMQATTTEEKVTKVNSRKGIEFKPRNPPNTSSSDSLLWWLTVETGKLVAINLIPSIFLNMMFIRYWARKKNLQKYPTPSSIRSSGCKCSASAAQCNCEKANSILGGDTSANEVASTDGSLDEYLSSLDDLTTQSLHGIRIRPETDSFEDTIDDGMDEPRIILERDDGSNLEVLEVPLQEEDNEFVGSIRTSNTSVMSGERKQETHFQVADQSDFFSENSTTTEVCVESAQQHMNTPFSNTENSAQNRDYQTDELDFEPYEKEIEKDLAKDVPGEFENLSDRGAVETRRKETEVPKRKRSLCNPRKIPTQGYSETEWRKMWHDIFHRRSGTTQRIHAAGDSNEETCFDQAESDGLNINLQYSTALGNRAVTRDQLLGYT